MVTGADGTPILSRDNSWQRFVKPDKLGSNNHIQKALNVV